MGVVGRLVIDVMPDRRAWRGPDPRLRRTPQLRRERTLSPRQRLPTAARLRLSPHSSDPPSDGGRSTAMTSRSSARRRPTPGNRRSVRGRFHTRTWRRIALDRHPNRGTPGSPCLPSPCREPWWPSSSIRGHVLLPRSPATATPDPEPLVPPISPTDRCRNARPRGGPYPVSNCPFSSSSRTCRHRFSHLGRHRRTLGQRPPRLVRGPVSNTCSPFSGPRPPNREVRE